MNFPKPSPGSTAQFAEVAPKEPDVTYRTMFGFPACFVNGNMFMGLHGDEMILRLSDSRHSEFLAEGGGRVFEPMPGRPMKDYALVSEEVRADRAMLDLWIGHSLAFARSLPPKEKKKKKEKAARPK